MKVGDGRPGRNYYNTFHFLRYKRNVEANRQKKEQRIFKNNTYYFPFYNGVFPYFGVWRRRFYFPRILSFNEYWWNPIRPDEFDQDYLTSGSFFLGPVFVGFFFAAV